MLRMFRSKDSAMAIEFADGSPSTVKEIMKLTGLRVTVEYNPDGSVLAGLIKSETDIIPIQLGQYVYKESNGKIGVCDYEHLIEKYEEITETTESNDPTKSAE